MEYTQHSKELFLWNFSLKLLINSLDESMKMNKIPKVIIEFVDAKRR